MYVALGWFEDTITDIQGNVIDVISGRNQAQDLQSTLTAALFKPGNILGGIQYLALGSGDVSWDITAPTLDPTDTTLMVETHRIQIAPVDVVFLDPITELPVAGPTAMLETTVHIGIDVVGDLREFGLFGGDATTAADSGLMINWVSHPLISKIAAQIITRRIKLKWLTSAEAALFYCP